jgi:nicotinamide-nucleotide amidase
MVVHRTLLTSGIGESMIAEAIAGFENNLPHHVKLAYLPAYGMVRLRLTARGSTGEAIDAEVDQLFSQLKSLVQEWMVADEDITLHQAVIQLLKSKNKTISTAESCTGGNIAHLLTSIAGSSAVYKGSIVSYANEAKENLLTVKNETLKQFGAVSEQTVHEMVQGALQQLNTDYAIATSGIMGPGGGTEEKPVGTIWIAVANKEKIKTSKQFFRFDRERNIELTSHTALTMLFRFVKEQEPE